MSIIVNLAGMRLSGLKWQKRLYECQSNDEISYETMNESTCVAINSSFKAFPNVLGLAADVGVGGSDAL